MQYWLMKAEPDSRVVKGKDVKFSVDDFETINITPWEGVRNHSAKLNMKAMKVGDKVLFYHSNCKTPGIAAVAEVYKESYPDYTAWDATHPYYDQKSDASKPTWYMVDLQFKARLPNFVSLAFLRYLETCTHDNLETIASSVGVQNLDASKVVDPQGLSYLSEAELQAIKDMPLLSQGRLSVQRVGETAFNAISKLGQFGGWEGLSFNKPKPKGASAAAKRSKAKHNTREDSSPSPTESNTNGEGGSQKRRKITVDEPSGSEPRRSSRRHEK
ncbi:hypothetical protein FRB93_013356 [Tulasnella sp. JGI-2019a]|nr:hypothetical protein FRB93_013356 [Tulasnella sp. JGI-2019a]